MRLKRRRQEEREAEQREAKQMAAQQEGKKLGDAGYRYHARIPRASRPDFIKAPESAGAVRCLPCIVRRLHRCERALKRRAECDARHACAERADAAGEDAEGPQYAGTHEEGDARPAAQA